MQILPKIIYTKVLMVWIFINVLDDILIHTLMDDNDISPVINTSTDYKKSDHVYYLTSNTILICMHSVKYLYKYSNKSYHHESLRHCLSADE